MKTQRRTSNISPLRSHHLVQNSGCCVHAGRVRHLLQFVQLLVQLMRQISGREFHDIGLGRGVREVDEQLCETALGGSVVAEDVGKGGVTEWLGETLAKGLAGAIIIAQA
jgi:hypothetical protein